MSILKLQTEKSSDGEHMPEIDPSFLKNNFLKDFLI